MTQLARKNWASARAYAEAIQAPALCFRDRELRQTEAAFDRLGMPLVTSGQFAYVFKLKQPAPAPPLAVRCFRADAADRELRYRHIAAYLARHSVPALGAFKYDAEGILVAGQTYPTLVMEWIEGHTLDVYLEETIGNRAVLLHLADEWLRLMRALNKAGIAHGDLQHGNIIVQRGNLRLIDFDGMFVPALAGMSAGEVGHQHYQHPQRDEMFFDATLDRFSALVIYTSLVALAERPALWAEHHDENLIFTKDDFLAPESSALFAKIKEIGGEPARLAGMLAASAKGEARDTPDVLAEFAPKTKLPAWMNDEDDATDHADVWLEVEGRTREATRVDVPVSVQVKDFTQAAHGGTHTRSNVPTTPGTPHMQTLFGSTAPAAAATARLDPYTAPLDSSQLLPATFHYAKDAARQGVAFVWLLIWVGTGFFRLLGASTALSWMLAALTFIIPCLIYGFHRAYGKLASGTPQPALLGANLSGGRNLSYGAATTNALSALHNNTARVVVGSRTQSIYHLDSCIWAARIAARNRIAFATEQEAHAAGYQACKVCLP